jgi:hypothetical protein
MESASRVWSQETNDSDDTEVMGDLDTAEGAGAGDDDEMKMEGKRKTYKVYFSSSKNSRL